MNFNHLITEESNKKVCHSLGHKECYYQPVGDPRAMIGDNIHIQLSCRNCRRRQDIFLTEEDFKTHKRTLSNEIGKL